MNEIDFTPEEAAEAKALAEALEHRPAPQVPADALEVAALLRFAREGGLTPARRRSIGRALRPGRPSRLRAIGFGAAAALAATLAAIFLSPSATPLPPPDLGLLRAQSQAAAGDPASGASLDARMRDYRAQVLGSLARRYGR